MRRASARAPALFTCSAGRFPKSSIRGYCCLQKCIILVYLVPSNKPEAVLPATDERMCAVLKKGKYLPSRIMRYFQILKTTDSVVEYRGGKNVTENIMSTNILSKIENVIWFYWWCYTRISIVRNCIVIKIPIFYWDFNRKKIFPGIQNCNDRAETRNYVVL